MMSYSLAELLITASAEAWRGDGEVLATGFGPLARLGTFLAKASFNPQLALTDGECWYVETPVPLGAKGDVKVEVEGWAPYDRVFSSLWGGRRHAMVTPVQIDRYGQVNISIIGEHAKPKVAMLGARGLPGNSIHHPNSFFFQQHTTRSFVKAEVDYVCAAGYNPNRWPGARYPAGLELRRIVSNLCVMDFAGPAHQIRVISLHPGVSFEEVQDNTGFELARIENLAQTAAPSAQQLQLIAKLDPNNIRKTVFKGDPPGDRREGTS